MRDIKRRKKAIENIKQITRAMMLVAAAKLKRAQEICIKSKVYAHTLEEVISHITLRYKIGELHLPKWDKFFCSIEDEKECVVIFTSNQGLCGNYNTNIIKETKYILSKRDIKLIIIGKKGFIFFKKEYPSFILDYFLLPSKLSFKFAEEIADKILEFYNCGIISACSLIYNEFISPLRQRTKKRTLIPFSQEPMPSSRILTDYIYEPNPEDLLSNLVPLYIKFQIYSTLLEAEASEHASRMQAMQLATNNADKLINSLWLAFNKARQESVTKELLDIISCSEALKKR